LTFTGDFITDATNLSDWICEDQEWLDNRTVTIQSTDVINMTDANLNVNWTIPATAIRIFSEQATKEAWECTVGTYVTTWHNLATAKTIFGKDGEQYEVCRIGVHEAVTLDVTTLPSQPIWVYSGLITVTSPF
jgi:hypothetical protein